MHPPLGRAALGAAALILLSCSDAGMLTPVALEPPRFSLLGGQPAVRISEIHYDNASTDVDEAIEISGPAGTDLTGWSVVLYNGANGLAYNTRTLSGTIPATCAPRGVVTLSYPVNGIQNGSPDGLALVDPAGTVVEFLSYEGRFTAVDGPAAGLESSDIGVAEGFTTPVGHSLQRLGTGEWQAPAPHTFGACNEGDEPLPEIRLVELHYDNDGTDAGEAIEIEGPAGADLTGWSVVLYNGANGLVYDTDALSGTIVGRCGGRGVVVLNYPVNGIQNGSPDGLALVDPAGTVVEFLSYEGTFTAVDGPAAGLESSDIGVAEGFTTPVGHSLQRLGTGAWQASAPHTFGSCNEGDDPPPPPPLPEIRFVELHYDNTGTDVGEAIEIEGPAGADLSGWSVVLYNGSNGLVYDTDALSGTIAERCDGRGVVVLTFPSNGIQNGSPDGLALVDAAGTVIEFLSYEGTFAAAGGPADGLTSTDIGVTEGSSTPAGHSLQRLRTGVWQSPAPHTFGACNEGDEGPPPPPVFTITFSGRFASDPPLPVGFQDQLFATLVDGTGTVVPTTFTWTSDTPGVAGIDQDGVCTALAPGTAVLRATAADGTSGTISLPAHQATASATALYGNHVEFGEPADADPSDDFIVERAQYTASYSALRGTPNWVSYNLEATHFGGEDRCDCFTFDPALPPDFPSYTTAAYTGSGAFHGFGIDRGHLARSFDRTSGSLDNATTYYFTNIVPQAADLNQGPWAAFESYLGDLARLENREVYIITGVAGSKGTLKDEGRIVMPAQTWKVALVLPRDHGLPHVGSSDDVEAIAVIMPNDPGVRNVPWETYRTTVDAVEALSGYDLLARLPDQVESAVESGVARAITLVEQLVAQGRMSRGNGTSLIAKLRAAAYQLGRGGVVPAVNQLESFLAELDALIEAGRLGADDAAELRAWVLRVIASVTGG